MSSLLPVHRTSLSRRGLLFSASLLPASFWLRAANLPEPRVEKLAQWKKIKGLEKLAPAFEFLLSHDMKTIALGRHEIDGSNIYCTVSESATKAGEGLFETHRHFADVHYIVTGEEKIGVAAKDSLTVKDPYVESGDIEKYTPSAKYSTLELHAGEFAVMLPGQAHMPGMAIHQPGPMRKAVVKVRMA